MVQEIKLILRENNEVLKTVIKETSTHPFHLAQSLEEFQRTANAAITKIIEDLGGSGEVMEIEEDEETEDDDDNFPSSAKKEKK